MRKYLLPISFIGTFLLTSLFGFAQQWTELNPPLNPFNHTIRTTALGEGDTVYAAGEFTDASGAYFVARWDGNSWSELGQGTSSLNANGAILSIVSRGGNVYAAGFFSNASGKNYVAHWNGSRWEELGTGSNALNANNLIYSVAFDPQGNLYAAGRFTDSLGARYVAKWNGTTWSQVGSGTSALQANADIFTVASDTAGNLYCGGYFTNASGKEYVAKWNGIKWSELGSSANALNANDAIMSIATDLQGNVYAGGAFRDDSSHYYLAKWNGSKWSSLGLLDYNITIATIAVRSANEIYAAGYSPYATSPIAKWNGTSWSEVNSLQNALVANGDVLSLQISSGDELFAGGTFTNKSGHSFLGQWNGTGWKETGGKGDPFFTAQPIYQILGDSVGNVYVSGNFVNSVGRTYIEHWDGKSWLQLGFPDTSHLFLFINSSSHHMQLDRKGNLYVTGRRQLTVDSGYDCILKWDGLQWSIWENSANELQTYNSNPVYGIGGMETDSSGNIYIGGNFRDSANHLISLAKWNGKSWSKYPGIGGYSQFCISNDRNLYAFGGFTNSVGKAVIVKYNLSDPFNWGEVKNGSNELSAAGFNVFTAIGADSNDNVYVNGNFRDSAGTRYIAKWDGKSWSELGATNSLGTALIIDRDNSLYTSNGVNYSGGSSIQKWNGTAWVGLGAPIDANGVHTNGSVLAADRAGNIYTDALSPLSGVGYYIAKYTTTAQAPPQLSSFAPQKGSVGTTITIKGYHLASTAAVRFGGTEAASFAVQNDSTLTAVVAYGSTGSVWVGTPDGSDSLTTFTYTCDSVKGQVPSVGLMNDSTLVSSYASYYEWYYNNQPLQNANSNHLKIKGTGFYHVATSEDKVCWTPSIDYPVLVNPNPLSDSIQVSTYPNPSNGNFTVDVRLPQTTTVLTYVSVYDINGAQLLQTQKLIFYGNDIKFPVTISSKGTFVVKVFINGDTRQQTIMIL